MKEGQKALVLYIVLIAILFAPVFFNAQSTLLYGSDIHSQHYFFKKFMVDSMQQGIFPWWNPYQFGGTPFFANPQVAPLYPLNIVFFIVSISLAFPLFIAIHLCIGMMGMYRLIRQYVDTLSAWVGGVLFGLSGFFIIRTLSGHIGIIASSAWTPWIVWLWIYWVTEKNWKIFFLASFFVGMQLMAGYQSIVIFTFELLTVASIVLCFSTRSFKPFFSLFLLGILGFGLSAYQMLPIIEFLRLSIRTMPLPFSWAATGASTFSSLLLILFPYAFGTPSTFTGPPVNFGEHASYLGIIGSGLALLSSILFLLSGIGMIIPSLSYRYPKKLRIMTGIALLIIVVGLILALSTNVPIPIHKSIWTIIPFFRTLRIPSRQLFLVVFAGSILAGFGIAFIKNKSARIVLSLAIVVEMMLTGSTFISSHPSPESTYDNDLIASFTPVSSLFRIVSNFGCWIEPMSSFPFNVPMTKALFSTTGYDPMIYRPYYDFIDATNGSSDSSILFTDVQIPYISLSSEALKYLNIKYILTPTYTSDPLDGKNTETFSLVKEQPERTYRVYENTIVYPRFYFVPSLTSFGSNEALVSAIREQRINFFESAAVEKKDMQLVPFQPDCMAGEKGTVEVLSYTPNTIDLRVSTPCNAFLTSSEVMYPGWTATIDGKRASIITGNMAFRVLPITKGTHSIEYRFIPYSFFVGCIISFLFGVGALFFVFRDTHVFLKKP